MIKAIESRLNAGKTKEEAEKAMLRYMELKSDLDRYIEEHLEMNETGQEDNDGLV